MVSIAQPRLGTVSISIMNIGLVIGITIIVIVNMIRILSDVDWRSRGMRFLVHRVAGQGVPETGPGF